MRLKTAYPIQDSTKLSAANVLNVEKGLTRKRLKGALQASIQYDAASAWMEASLRNERGIAQILFSSVLLSSRLSL